MTAYKSRYKYRYKNKYRCRYRYRYRHKYRHMMARQCRARERWRKGTTIVTGSYSRQYTHGQVLAAQENISLGKTARFN